MAHEVDFVKHDVIISSYFCMCIALVGNQLIFESFVLDVLKIING